MARQTETRQIEVLRYIHEQVSQKGYPPTVREIGEAVQLSSTSTVHGHLARLEKKGFIQRDPTKPRAIELTKQGLAKPFYEALAKSLSEKASRDDVDNTRLIEAYRYLGYYYLLQGNKATADSYWKKVLELDPNNEVAKQALGMK